jgi:predicted transposase YbfD/YdcC
MVEDKSNEIPAARKLLERCDVEGAMVLTDALHTQTLSAREIVQGCGADYLMTVKANQKGLLRKQFATRFTEWLFAVVYDKVHDIGAPVLRNFQRSMRSASKRISHGQPKRCQRGA